MGGRVEQVSTDPATSGGKPNHLHDVRVNTLVGDCSCRRYTELMAVRVEYVGQGGLRLVGDAYGDPGNPPVVLLHGGGQTRHAWGGTGEALALAGFHAVCIDQRGHGDSEWADDGDYRVDAFAADLVAVARALERPVAVVGASLGGMAALIAHAEYSHRFAAVVLVDIAPRIEVEGVTRIISFMTANPDGFASLEEAADAVAEFLPHRPRPTDLSGLSKNLRLGEDGRYHWHWDPRFITDKRLKGPSVTHESLAEAARTLDVPTLLVRGRMSDVLSESAAREFLDMVPHARFVDVASAAHMVAGDRNDRFTDAVVEFLNRPSDGS
jgi:non-heme chloroperoxidase